MGHGPRISKRDRVLINRVIRDHTYGVSRLLKHRMQVNMGMVEIPGRCRWTMVAVPGVIGSAMTVNVMPLQFGGGFIELAILFLILALVAAVLGARGVAGVSMEIAKWLVIIFVVLAIITFIL